MTNREERLLLTFEDLPLHAIHALLGQNFSPNLLVAISRCQPISEPLPEHFDEFLQHHQVTVGWIPKPTFDPRVLPRVDRSTTERFLAAVLARDLAYKQARLPHETAVQASRSFLEPFGKESWYYSNIEVDPEKLDANEPRLSGSYCVFTQIFGNTLEAGVFAIDPRGYIGAFFVGDED